MGLSVAALLYTASLIVAALSSAHWAAQGYAIAIYALFAVMFVSGWSVRIRQTGALAFLSELETYLLHRHRVFFYFPFGAASFGHFCNWTRIFALVWAAFCVWQAWYWLATLLAIFYALTTPLLVIWIPIPHYQKLVLRGHSWAQERLNAIQRILDLRDSLRF